MFDLYPNMDFKTYVSDFRHSLVHQLLKKEDQESTEFEVMVLDSSKLMELCYLYPSTAVTLKYRALDRRNYWLKEM